MLLLLPRLTHKYILLIVKTKRDSIVSAHVNLHNVSVVLYRPWHELVESPATDDRPMKV